jgi:hypothetical protein
MSIPSDVILLVAQWLFSQAMTPLWGQFSTTGV